MADHHVPAAGEPPLGPRTAPPPDPDAAATPTEPEPADAPSGGQFHRALDDRLAFGHAQRLLTGLSGCTAEAAAQALRNVAAQLGVVPVALATTFLRAAVSLHDGRSEACVVQLVDAALAADADGAHDVPPGGPEDPARG